jgi:hypothetical protein
MFSLGKAGKIGNSGQPCDRLPAQQRYLHGPSWAGIDIRPRGEE